MRLVFDERKATQAAAYLLTKSNGSQDKLKLMKLLYLADRQSLVESGYSITGDAPYSMQFGPMLSNTLNLMNEGTEVGDSLWEKCIELQPEYRVVLTDDPGRDDLSDYELEILDQIFEHYGSMNKWSLVRFTHTLPEYDETVGSSSYPISVDALLASPGIDPSTVRDRRAFAREIELMDRLPRRS